MFEAKLNLTLGGLNNGGLHESSDEDCLFLNIYVPDVESRWSNLIQDRPIILDLFPVVSFSLFSSGPTAEGTTQDQEERLTLAHSTFSAMVSWWSPFDTGAVVPSHPQIAQARHSGVHVLGHRGGARQHGDQRPSGSLAMDSGKRFWLRRRPGSGDRDGSECRIHGNDVPYVLAPGSGAFPASHPSEWNWRLCPVLQAL